MGEVVALSVLLMIPVVHVISIVLSLGMPLALWQFWKGGHWDLLWRWGIATLVCIFVAIWVMPELQHRWNEHIGNFGDRKKTAPTLIAYVMAGFFGPMLIPEPARWAKKRLRHERGGHRRRRRRE